MESARLAALISKTSKITPAMPVLTLDQIKEQYPDQWVLIGDPELREPELNGLIAPRLRWGTVLLASKDKREIGFLAKDVRGKAAKTVCIYTGEVPKNRRFLL